MNEISKIFKTVFILVFVFSAQAESKILSIGNPDAKVTVKVFSSLTCPHCATFHTSIFNKLKKEYIDEGLVRFEHHAFPCLLYTSPSPRDKRQSRMPSSA